MSKRIGSYLGTVTLCLCLANLLASVQALQLSDTCKEKLFPVTLGGFRGNDIVSCTLKFEEHDLILVAGNSTSDDFGPSNRSHGYVSAIDTDGNVRWGHYFTNNSQPVSTISGCHKSSRGQAVFLGQSEGLPVVLELSALTGMISKFVTLDQIRKENETISKYVTFGGIYKDENDPSDGQHYYYITYIENK